MVMKVAWLVTRGDKKLGILNEDVQGRYFYITGKSVKLFDDDLATAKYFGNVNLFTETINEPMSKILLIKGHLIEYEEAIPPKPQR